MGAGYCYYYPRVTGTQNHTGSDLSVYDPSDVGKSYTPPTTNGSFSPVADASITGYDLWFYCTYTNNDAVQKIPVLILDYFLHQEEKYANLKLENMQARIVVVEDDELIRETIILLLEHRGYEVCGSATGKDLFELLTDFQPNLVLMDINLGELNGRDICRELKQHPIYYTIPIVIISGESDLYNSIPSEGANDVILKPFDEMALMSRIERQLENCKHSQI